MPYIRKIIVDKHNFNNYNVAVWLANANSEQICLIECEGCDGNDAA